MTGGELLANSHQSWELLCLMSAHHLFLTTAYRTSQAAKFNIHETLNMRAKLQIWQHRNQITAKTLCFCWESLKVDLPQCSLFSL